MILCSLGCENSPPEIVGDYEIVEYSISDKLWYGGIKGYDLISGSSITINSDSTFKYITCGNVMNGNWRIVTDTLILDVISNQWRIDSLNIYGFEGKCAEDDIGITKFQIGKNYIQIIDRVTTDGQIEKVIERMYKKKI